MVNKKQSELKQYSSLKVLQILLALSEANGFLTISYISEQTGLSVSSIHRILQELLSTGFVIKNEENKAYGIGYEMVALASRFQRTDLLIEAARSEMQRLNNLTRETINLIALDKYQAVYIDKAEAQNQIQLRSKVGWKIPLYCTSGGKMLLAHQTEEWLDDFFKIVPLKRYTDYTIVNEHDLRMELERIRKNGYSVDIEEHNLDIICICAPVFSRDGKIQATIGVSAPKYRFPIEKALSLKSEVIGAARIISDRLR